VVAAALPALFYYLCLFIQVDSIAAREGLSGVPRSQLPRLLTVLRKGWGFVLPLAVLIYLLFWRGATPAFAALAASTVLLVFALFNRRMWTWGEWSALIFGGGQGMIPLIMIGAAAGVVVGVMNATGLGQSLSFILVDAGSTWGLLPMLAVTAVLCVILGMGMPTTAIYVILATVIAPALMKMGVAQMAAHLFIFYFGVMSFLTPPVAVSSYVAAGLADASMWRTGWIGMRLASISMLLPFVWAYDPALLLDGSWLSIGIVILTTTAAIFVVSRGFINLQEAERSGIAAGVVLLVAALAIGSSPIWLGAESLLTGSVAVAALIACKLLPANHSARLKAADA
jgi:TRAP transporter 4TM/12TM fusion protein